MVLASRRPRTVLGRLVGRAVLLGCSVLRPPGWLPLGCGGPAVPAGLPARGCSGGSSPAADPLVAAGPPGPSPRPVAERTPADHHRGRMMAGGGRGSLLLQRGEPVLTPPAGGVSGVDRDHRDAGVGSHLGEAVPELSGGDARDQPPEAPSAPAVGRPAAMVLASLLAGISEVKVFDHDCLAAVLPGGAGAGGGGGRGPPLPPRGGAPRPGPAEGYRPARPGSRPGGPPPRAGGPG